MLQKIRFFSTDHTLLIWLLITFICGTLGAVLSHAFLMIFSFLTDFTGSLFYWIIVILPIFGGLVVGLIIQYQSKDVAGDGMPFYIHAIRDKKGSITIKTSVLKFIATLATVVSGGAGTFVGPMSFIACGTGNGIYHLAERLGNANFSAY